MAWNDGGTIGSGDYWEVMTAKDGGQEDGEITCEYTFKRRKSPRVTSVRCSMFSWLNTEH